MSNGVFSKTFEMYPKPPAPMSWNDYEARVKQEWNVLLNSPAGCDERTIHTFFTRHPSLVPGALSMTGPSGHAPFANTLISEAPLMGIGRRIPDFIWLANDSGNFTPVFIEIESPCKRWFTEGGVPDHHLTQAVNQLAEWRAWLNRPENVLIFYDNFQIPGDLRRHHHFRPEFVLIYGRRAEFDARPHLRRLRDQFERHGQVVMTYDRLEPDERCSDFICATKTGERYRAVSVPATLQLGPMYSDSWLLFENIPETVRTNSWLSEERKSFLIERIAYWSEWSRSRAGHGYMASTSDWE